MNLIQIPHDILVLDMVQKGTRGTPKTRLARRIPDPSYHELGGLYSPSATDMPASEQPSLPARPAVLEPPILEA